MTGPTKAQLKMLQLLAQGWTLYIGQNTYKRDYARLVTDKGQVQTTRVDLIRNLHKAGWIVNVPDAIEGSLYEISEAGRVIVQTYSLGSWANAYQETKAP